MSRAESQTPVAFANAQGGTLAVREALINAVVHRDCADPGNVQVRIFSDRGGHWEVVA